MNMRKMICGCLAILCFALTAEAKGALYDSQPLIHVGLWTNQSTLYVSADAPFVVRDAKNSKIIRKYKAGAQVYLVVKNDKLMLDNKAVGTNELLLSREKSGSGQTVTVNKKKYRGDIKIVKPGKAGMTAINILPIEQYLYSIVPGEMPTSWPMEAIKAQAVAARTFALNGIDKHAKEGFQVCATTHCQVYGGASVESERSTKAVNDTNGLTLLYQGKPISAVFHSSSGGYTENSEDVWGTYLPYLRAVPDDDKDSPNYSWEKKLTPLEIQNKLQSYGHAVGKLQAIELSPLKKNGKNGADRTSKGRVKTARFIGDKGSVSLTGAQIRSMFGLNSAWFDLHLIIPSESKIDVPIGRYYKKKIDVDLPPYKEKGLITDKENIRRIHWRDGETVVVEGFGYGHGLGLSQWGAKAMAAKAPEKNTAYFKEILKHYYQGSELKKVY